MLSREKLIKSMGYWLADIQLKLYDLIRNYLDKEKMSQAEFADKKLDASKSYVSQVLKQTLEGDFDAKLSTFIKLVLATGNVPKLQFVSIENAIDNDKKKPVRQQNNFKAEFSLSSLMNIKKIEEFSHKGKMSEGPEEHQKIPFYSDRPTRSTIDEAA